jgi:sulfite reductase alpha subunit-like flavoprotein
MTERTEKIYFLYGSQTGNSEQAAKEMADACATQLSPLAIQTMSGTKDLITVESLHMQLDDFIEIKRAAWTRLVVIVVSSYGVGQAPLGAYRFRELCDAWADIYQEKPNPKLLDGVHYAMCGLGDSKYRTYFTSKASALMLSDTLVLAFRLVRPVYMIMWLTFNILSTFLYFLY